MPSLDQKRVIFFGLWPVRSVFLYLLTKKEINSVLWRRLLMRKWGFSAHWEIYKHQTVALSLDQKVSLLSPTADKKINKRRTRNMWVAPSVDPKVNVRLLISTCRKRWKPIKVNYECARSLFIFVFFNLCLKNRNGTGAEVRTWKHIRMLKRKQKDLIEIPLKHYYVELMYELCAVCTLCTLLQLSERYFLGCFRYLRIIRASKIANTWLSIAHCMDRCRKKKNAEQSQNCLPFKNVKI